MATQKDSGHAKNAYNLDKLNQVLSTFGSAYNPVNAKITLAGLTTLHTNANAKLADFSQAFTAWKNATNKREIEFQDLDKFSTKLLGALQSTGATQQTIDDFNSLVRKMRGDSKNSKTAVVNSPIPSPTPTPNQTDNSISTSQQSFDNKLQHFSQMVLLLGSEPLYVPNETAYTVAKLQGKLTALTAANTAANLATANLKAARIARNTYFYQENSGLLDLIKQVKAYVKSIYGANSQQFAEVAAIPFFRVVAADKAN